MPNRVVIALKALAHVACLAPIVWLIFHLIENTIGPDPTRAAAFFTGRGTLRLLVITLAISPLRKLIPKLGWTIRFRRMLGLYAFFYACLHMLTYVWLYAGFSLSAMVDDISQRRFITAGLAAWIMLFPLALTSTSWSIRKLGGTNWRRLHWLTYAAAIAGVIHYWWGVKQGVRTPMEITIALGIVLGVRPVLAWARRQGLSRVPAERGIL